MRFQGNLIENLTAAAKSKDEVLVRELVLDGMANMIQNNPKEMIKTLRYSKVKISDKPSTEKLIEVASYNLHNNRIFQKNLAVTISKKGLANSNDYAEAEGSSGGGGGGGNIVSSIADMIGSIGKFGASRNDLKSEEARTKSKLFDKILGGGNKTNWMPIVVVAGVLLIGAMVVWRVTATKK